MSAENLLWGAPRIHGELLKLGFAVAQSTVAKYMVRKSDPSGQSWGTFLRNHAPHIAAMDLFVVPTIGFDLLSVLVIVQLARRELVWINATAHPTAEWIAQQIVEAFPWNEAPRYLIRDRDAIYGAAVRRRLRAMGIRDKPIALGSPWQNCFAERLIGTIRRECVDHVIAWDEPPRLWYSRYLVQGVARDMCLNKLPLFGGPKLHRHSVLSRSARNSTALTAAVPTSIPAAIVMLQSPSRRRLHRCGERTRRRRARRCRSIPG